MTGAVMREQIIEAVEPYISGAAKADVSQMHRLNAQGRTVCSDAWIAVGPHAREAARWNSQRIVHLAEWKDSVKAMCNCLTSTSAASQTPAEILHRLDNTRLK